MRIRIGSHTLTRAEERGASETEIQDVVTTGFSIPAKYGKMGKAKIHVSMRLRYREKAVSRTE